MGNASAPAIAESCRPSAPGCIPRAISAERPAARSRDSRPAGFSGRTTRSAPLALRPLRTGVHCACSSGHPLSYPWLTALPLVGALLELLKMSCLPGCGRLFTRSFMKVCIRLYMYGVGKVVFRAGCFRRGCHVTPAESVSSVSIENRVGCPLHRAQG